MVKVVKYFIAEIKERPDRNVELALIEDYSLKEAKKRLYKCFYKEQVKSIKRVPQSIVDEKKGRIVYTFPLRHAKR